MVEAAQSVIWISAELGPEAQVGGLGDVARRLPPLLARAGLDISIAVPGHSKMPRHPLVDRMPVLGRTFQIEKSNRDGVTLYVFRCDELFDRGGVYGDIEDDAYRFGVFAKAAVLWAEKLDIDIVHAHDWQAGLAPIITAKKSVFTVHNVAYQGVVSSDLVPAWGLPWDVATEQGLGFGWGKINLLKGGTIAANVVTTVSETHAWEIRTVEGGFGLSAVFSGVKLIGIMNGIDTVSWDPAKDKALVAHTPDHAWKQKNRAALRKKLEWPDSDRPMVCSVGRLVEQKGIDLLIAAAYHQPDFDFFVVGSGDPRLEQELRALQVARPDHVRAVIAYDDALSRLAIAASEFFVMPSRFEPGGLAQMQAQRYGAIPIVRRTGGLAESVTDMGEQKGNGICFAEATIGSLSHAFSRALQLWRTKDAYARLQRAAMATPVDWGDRVPAYLSLYARL